MNKLAPNTLSQTARSLLSLSAVLAVPAMAQNAGQLEEVTVTAQHRTESLQETQISISAFTANTLQELGVSNGLDLFGHVPNMNVQEYAGGRSGLSYSLRGIVNGETLVTFDPGVSVYIDSVLLAKNVGGVLDVMDLERVEVLRGPQGTLYGRNTMGGAINYISKKPVDEFEGYLKGTAGNYDTWNARGMLNVPLLGADNALGELNMRVAGATLNRNEGIQHNKYKAPEGQPQPPSDLGTIDRNIVAVQLQWKPRDDLSVLYATDITRIDETPYTVWVTYGGGPFAPYVESDESDYPKNGYWDYPNPVAHTSVDGQGLTIAWDVSDTMTVQSITGYRRMENRGGTDSDGTPLPIISTLDVQRFESLSQEFRLTGSLMDSQLEYTTGLFFWDENGDVYNTVTQSGQPNSGNTVGKYSNKSWAAYGQTTYHLTDKWDLTGGLRYTYEDRDMNKAAPIGLTPPLWYDNWVKMPGVEDTIFPKASDDFDNVSWLASVGYQWTDEVMSYAKVSTGFTSGGFNVRVQSREAFEKGFDEETLTSYELGLKSAWAGKYTANLALFFSDYSDKQINVFDRVTLGNVLQNADAEIYGLELDTLAQLTENWQVGLGWGYLHPKFTDFVNPQGEDITDTSNFTYAPHNTANGHVMYERPLDYGVFSARVDWTYRDNMYFLLAKPEPNSSDAFSLFNARVSLSDIKGPGHTTMNVSLWGKNLADEGYWVNGVPLGSFGINGWGTPRTYGADVELYF